MKENGKWMKGETSRASKNGEYILGSSDQPFSLPLVLPVKKRISGFLFSWKLL